MKQLYLPDILPLRTMALAGGLLFSLGLSAEWTAPAHSPLASGRWVKVFTGESGVYSISYQQLREMGFSDPAKVGVYGTGGAMLEMNFTSASGEILVPETLGQVAVRHDGDRLLFFARGVETVTWNNGSFTAGNRNIYSDRGAYFLSDTTAPVEMTETRGAGEGGAEVYSYFYHEKDLCHNPLQSGRLFLGENLVKDTPLAIPYSLPGLTAGTHTTVRFSLYARAGEAQKVRYSAGGISGSGNIAAYTDDVYFYPYDRSTFSGTLPAEGDFTVSVSGNDLEEANFDYLLMSYRREAGLQAGESRYLGVVAGAGCIAAGEAEVWDVTQAEAPVRLVAGENGFSTGAASPRSIVVFDPVEGPLPILGSEKVGNVDLLAMEVPDMLIITLPAYEEQCRRLAAVHEKLDGQKVAVVLASDIYNEFSSGKPDALAYRSLCKTLCQRDPERFANVLLVGPVLSDVRNLRGDEFGDRIAAFQSEESCTELNSYCVNDVTAMLDDYYPKGFQARRMSIGIGLLPVRTVDQLSMYVDKVERYLSDDSFAEWASMVHLLADYPDNHLHENSSEELIKNMRADCGERFIFERNYSDTKPSGQTSKDFFSALGRGAVFSTYFGHGMTQFFGNAKNNILHINQSRNVDNDRLSFSTFAGCEVSRFDSGVWGVGDAIVTDTRGGDIAALVSIRKTWAAQNTRFILDFQNALFNNIDPSTGQLPTLGEAVAIAKSSSELANKFNFQLVGDPAVRIPLPAAAISAQIPESVIPGSAIDLSGDVLDPAGNPATDFSGELCVRIVFPTRVIENPCYHSGNADKGYISYTQDVAASYSYKVSGGKFAISGLTVPPALESEKGKQAFIMLTAFDPKKRTTASSVFPLAVDPSEATVKPEGSFPVISAMEVENEGAGYILTADAGSGVGFRTDLYAVDTPVKMSVDGKALARLSDGTFSLSDGARCLSLRFPLGAITSGEHTISLQLTDFAGNRVERSLNFSTERYIPADLLSIGRAAVYEPVEITVAESEEICRDREIVITDSGNNIISVLPSDSGKVLWDLCDSSGNRVAPGLYKAVLRGTNSLNEVRTSSLLRLPVVR